MPDDIWVIEDDWDDYHGSAIIGYATSEEDAKEAIRTLKPRRCEECSDTSIIRVHKLPHWKAIPRVKGTEDEA